LKSAVLLGGMKVSMLVSLLCTKANWKEPAACKVGALMMMKTVAIAQDRIYRHSFFLLVVSILFS
jgi:hypothetical protein